MEPFSNVSKVLAGHASGSWRSALGPGLPEEEEKIPANKVVFAGTVLERVGWFPTFYWFLIMKASLTKI